MNNKSQKKGLLMRILMKKMSLKMIYWQKDHINKFHLMRKVNMYKRSKKYHRMRMRMQKIKLDSRVQFTIAKFYQKLKSK